MKEGFLKKVTQLRGDRALSGVSWGGLGFDGANQRECSSCKGEQESRGFRVWVCVKGDLGSWRLAWLGLGDGERVHRE